MVFFFEGFPYLKVIYAYSWESKKTLGTSEVQKQARISLIPDAKSRERPCIIQNLSQLQLSDVMRMDSAVMLRTNDPLNTLIRKRMRGRHVGG